MTRVSEILLYISTLSLLLIAEAEVVNISVSDMKKPTRTGRRTYIPPDANENIFDEISFTINSTCCQRHRKDTVIGFGMSGDMIQIDVGHCRKSCKSHHQIDLLAQLLSPSYEGKKIPLPKRSCPIESSCAEKSSRIERVSTLYGIQEITVVEECECREKPRECIRKPHSLTLYPDSPYKTTIDVGTCGGHCTLGGCRPIRNRTITVPGPNGARSYGVIEECACTGDCYRMSQFETVYDYSSQDDSVEISEEPVIKEIDVGVCVGSCRGIETGRCLYRDQDNPSNCLSGLYSKSSTCSPSKFQVHRYTNKRNETKEIVSVSDCRCV